MCLQNFYINFCLQHSLSLCHHNRPLQGIKGILCTVHVRTSPFLPSQWIPDCIVTNVACCIVFHKLRAQAQDLGRARACFRTKVVGLLVDTSQIKVGVRLSTDIQICQLKKHLEYNLLLNQYISWLNWPPALALQDSVYADRDFFAKPCAQACPSIFKAYTDLDGMKFIFIWEDRAALWEHSNTVPAASGICAGATNGEPPSPCFHWKCTIGMYT